MNDYETPDLTFKLRIPEMMIIINIFPGMIDVE